MIKKDQIKGLLYFPSISVFNVFYCYSRLYSLLFGGVDGTAGFLFPSQGLPMREGSFIPVGFLMPEALLEAFDASDEVLALCDDIPGRLEPPFSIFITLLFVLS